MSAQKARTGPRLAKALAAMIPAAMHTNNS
jgi:hypothetical protein